MSSIEKDRAAFALTRFDAQAFADEIRKRFDGGEDPPFIIDVCDFTGNRANWIAVSCGRATLDMITELVRMCERRGLHMYSEA